MRKGLPVAPVVASPGPPAAGGFGAQRHRLQRRHQRVRQGRPMAAGATAVGACGGDSRLGLRKCLCFGDDQFGVGYAQNQSDYTITSTLHTLGEQLSGLSSTVAADTLEFLEGF